MTSALAHGARRYSLAFLTVPDIGPLEAIQVAAEAGYQMIGLRLLPATAEESPSPLLCNEKLLRAVGAALDDSGIDIGDVEIIRLTPVMDHEYFLPFFDTTRFLNARHITVVNDETPWTAGPSRPSPVCASRPLPSVWS